MVNGSRVLVTHVTHPDLLTHLTHDPLTHCQLCLRASFNTTTLSPSDENLSPSDWVLGNWMDKFSSHQLIFFSLNFQQNLGLSQGNLCVSEVVCSSYGCYSWNLVNLIVGQPVLIRDPRDPPRFVDPFDPLTHCQLCCRFGGWGLDPLNICMRYVLTQSMFWPPIMSILLFNTVVG